MWVWIGFFHLDHSLGVEAVAEVVKGLEDVHLFHRNFVLPSPLSQNLPTHITTVPLKSNESLLSLGTKRMSAVAQRVALRLVAVSCTSM